MAQNNHKIAAKPHEDAAKAHHLAESIMVKKITRPLMNILKSPSTLRCCT
jgi:hypothetical protein